MGTGRAASPPRGALTEALRPYRVLGRSLDEHSVIPRVPGLSSEDEWTRTADLPWFSATRPILMAHAVAGNGQLWEHR